jgi:hypothetical protein
MWDPMSVLFCMWVLNVGFPDARLKVSDMIKAREEKIIVDSIQKSATIREL